MGFSENIRKKFDLFHTRMKLRGSVQSAFSALLTASAVLFAAQILLHLLGRSIPAAHSALLFGASFLLSFALFYALLYRPSRKTTAAQIDALGLEERIITMLACEGDEATLPALQREDAARALLKTDPRRIAIRIPPRRAALALALLCAALALHAVPYDLLFSPAPAHIETEEERAIREMIESLRAQIESSDISDEEKQRLLDELNDIQNRAQAEEATLDLLAQVSQATGELVHTLDEIEYYQRWVSCLLDFEPLSPLAQALLDEDVDAVARAMFDLEDGILALEGMSRLNRLMDIHTTIDLNLDLYPSADEEAQLLYTFKSFGDDLQNCAMYVMTNLPSSDVLHASFTRARKRFIAYLQGEIEYEAVSEEELDESTPIRYTRSDSQEDEEKPAAEGSQQTGGEQQTLYSDSDEDRQGSGTGTREEQYHAFSETVYEPSLDTFGLPDNYAPGAKKPDGGVYRELAVPYQNNGSVPYDRVYGIYYGKLLQRMDDDALPDALREAIEAYFYTL